MNSDEMFFSRCPTRWVSQIYYIDHGTERFLLNIAEPGSSMERRFPRDEQRAMAQDHLFLPQIVSGKALKRTELAIITHTQNQIAESKKTESATMAADKAKKNMADSGAKKQASTKKKELTALPFELKELHQKALLKLWHCHHFGTLLTYPDLSREIEVGEKTKKWQSGAWKDLKGGGFIIPGPENKTFVLSPKGVELAESLASDEELAEFATPITNEDLHEKIRKRLEKDKAPNGKKHRGKEIFDVFLDDQGEGLLRLELAAKLGTNADSHQFFYGFKALEKMGLVSKAGKVTQEELLARQAQALEGKPNNKKGGKKRNHKVEDIKTEEKDGQEDSKTLKKKKDIVVIIKTEEKDGQEGSKILEKIAKVEGIKNEEKDGQEDFEKPKKKTKIRGGPTLFQLSEKAFLVTTKTA